MKAATAQIQTTRDFAIREINALEQKIEVAEGQADAMLWEQARHVFEQLNAGAIQEQLAAQWKNTEGKSYTQAHVSYVAKAYRYKHAYKPRPRFRDVYNEVAHSKFAIHHSSESSEHYTPPEIVQLVTACLGAIDLDPCSNADHTIPAKTHYTAQENGLDRPWRGRVYMNPPYGDGIDRWVAKLCAEHERGDVSEAIALVPARPDTQWFKCLRNYVCCFVEGRLTFGGSTDPAPFPSAIFYLGDDIGKFYHQFTGTGDIWQRLEPGMFAE